MIKKSDLDAMTTDQLWQLHELIGEMLSSRLVSQKRELEKRLSSLKHNKLKSSPALIHEKRYYPRVHPKYKNTQAPYETWSGRGKTPRWLTAALKAGRTLEEFAVAIRGKSAGRSGR